MVLTIIQGLGKSANFHTRTWITDANLDLLSLPLASCQDAKGLRVQTRDAGLVVPLCRAPGGGAETLPVTLPGRAHDLAGPLTYRG